MTRAGVRAASMSMSHAAVFLGLAALVVADLPFTSSVVWSSAPKVNVSVSMVSKRSARLSWWPHNAFVGRAVEVVFSPEQAGYKVLMPVTDPIGHSLVLPDLRAYTVYNLDIRSKDESNGNGNGTSTGHGWVLHASLNFSTSVMDGDAMQVHAPSEFWHVQMDEVCIVVMVLFVWLGAVYVFFNQWDKLNPPSQHYYYSKIRGILPYQPDYRKFDDPLLLQDGDDVDSLGMAAAACAQCDARQYHLCRKAVTFDELLASRGLVDASGRPHHRMGFRNNSAVFICEADSDLAAHPPSNMRKTRSAESVLCNPRIIVNRSFDIREDDEDESGDMHEEGEGGGEAQHDQHQHPLFEASNLLQLPRIPGYPVPDSSSEHHLAAATSGQSANAAPAAGFASLVHHGHMVEASKNVFLQSIRNGPSTSSKQPPTLLLSVDGFGARPQSPTAYEVEEPWFHAHAHHAHAHLTATGSGPPPSIFFRPPRLRQQLTRRQASLAENSIPLTTTLVHRMAKRPVGSATAANSPASAMAMRRHYLVQHQRSSEPDYYKRGPSRFSPSDSADSTSKHMSSSSAVGMNMGMPMGLGAASQPGPGSHLPAPHQMSCYGKQRYGSFRRRLQKQHPILLSDSDNMPAYLVALTPTSPECGRAGSANSAHMMSRGDVLSPASSRDASHDATEVRRTGYYFSSSAESASASRHEDSIEVVQINAAQHHHQQQPSKLAQSTAFPRQHSDAQVYRLPKAAHHRNSLNQIVPVPVCAYEPQHPFRQQHQQQQQQYPHPQQHWHTYQIEMQQLVQPSHQLSAKEEPAKQQQLPDEQPQPPPLSQSQFVPQPQSQNGDPELGHDAAPPPANERSCASGEQRWSICSETEAIRPKESFFRFGSSCQLQSSEDKSAGEEDNPDPDAMRKASSSPVTSPRVAVTPQSPPYRAMNND